MNTVVVNKRHSRFDVDITRNGPYGNPYRITAGARTREQAISLFETLWLARLAGPDHEKYRAALEHLRGKRLGCVCRPLPCHGDVLVRLLGPVRSMVG